ncbi:unnamed protein product [Mytilus edulis]|uniref:Uncharacterized protein n=1 Tax=Mytilus edulis TaxID=6550 RepID=A0A8S3SLA1_MYTED|nr:unnamed protein product [Mytilus edulis]
MTKAVIADTLKAHNCILNSISQFNESNEYIMNICNKVDLSASPLFFAFKDHILIEDEETLTHLIKQKTKKWEEIRGSFKTVDEHDHDEARQQPKNDNIASVDNTDQDENVDHTELEVPTIPPAKKQSEKRTITAKHLLARQKHQKEIKMEIVIM